MDSTGRLRDNLCTHRIPINAVNVKLATFNLGCQRILTRMSFIILMKTHLLHYYILFLTRKQYVILFISFVFRSGTVVEPLLPDAVSQSTSSRATPTRVAKLKAESDVERPTIVSSTRSSPRLQLATDAPVSYQRRPLHLCDLFTDSEGECNRDSFESRPIKQYSEPSGRKVLSPLNSMKLANERVTVRSRKTVAGRKSACCQTSPELLALAKAEALGRRAAQIANEHFR